MNFVYPIIPNNNLPTSNPHDTLFKFLPFHWMFKKWVLPITQNINYIKQKFADGYLPIGTKLYHGSLDTNLDFRSLTKDRITFFGLDVVISIWYILEMTLYYSYLRIGKLYEFTVVKPIPIYLLSELFDHPMETKECSKQVACIHPQLAYHGDTDDPPPYDLSIEVTMNMKYFKDYIQLNKTYLVNTKMLYDNRCKLFTEFNPVTAIIEQVPNTKNGGKLKTRKKTKVFRMK
jgi:hypothetical protein